MTRPVKWLPAAIKWETLALSLLLVLAACLFVYNLKYSPRPWQDEGAALSVAKSVAEDGVYATRTSAGYQTFGPIQSVGPTVILPVALAFKVFGAGFVQGRMVMALYSLVGLLLCYSLGRALFGGWAALLATAVLLASPAVKYMYWGRQVLGEIPALSFFLAGCLVWARLSGSRSISRALLVGLLFGAALLTKMQYGLMIFGALAGVLVLDLIYYRQRRTRQITLIALAAGATLATWWGWQRLYFGQATFVENMAKLGQLARATSGFDVHSMGDALTFLLGTQSAHFHYLWGFPALLYTGYLARRRDETGFLLAFLLLCAGLIVAYFVLWTVPWQNYVLPAGAIAGLAVGKLGADIGRGLKDAWPAFWRELRISWVRGAALSTSAILTAAGLLALAVLAGSLLFDAADGARSAVLVRDTTPEETAAFLSARVGPDTVVETWERELGILTGHLYHYPDQVLLARTHAALYRKGTHDYRLGADYFARYQPGYVVVGRFARWLQIYDDVFLSQHASLIATFGAGPDRYDVYKMDVFPAALIGDNSLWKHAKYRNPR